MAHCSREYKKVARKEQPIFLRFRPFTKGLNRANNQTIAGIIADLKDRGDM